MFSRTSFLALIAAFLCAGLLSFIGLEAFDDDLDLWPPGTENITVTPRQASTNGRQTVNVSASQLTFRRAASSADLRLALKQRAWHATSPVGPSIGVHLVLRHRARIDIAADGPFNLNAFHMAESPGATILGSPGHSAISFW